MKSLFFFVFTFVLVFTALCNKDGNSGIEKVFISDDLQISKIDPNGKEYDIRFDSSRLEWACDCKAFQFRRRHKIKYCKHIIEIQDKLLAERRGRAGARVV